METNSKLMDWAAKIKIPEEKGILTQEEWEARIRKKLRKQKA